MLMLSKESTCQRTLIKADTDCDELEKEKMNQNKENIQEIITTCLEEPQSN